MEESSAAVAETLAVEAPSAKPAQKNVFKRLYSGFKVGETKLNKTGSKVEETEKTPSKAAKGRQVSSKFSGVIVARSTKKYDSQKQCLAKKFSFKTPTSNQQRASSAIAADDKLKTPASVRLARSKLESARYWLSLVTVAEKAGKHSVSLGLFRLAIDCEAKPVADIRKEFSAYTARYNLSSSVPDLKPKVDEHVPDVESASEHAPVTTTLDSTQADGSDVSKEVKSSCDDEESSRVSVVEKINPEDDASSEVINIDHANETGVTSLLDTQKSPPRSSAEVIARRTPRRASAIRAIQRIEESNKKQPRRKQPASEQREVNVEKMDVDKLMEEVVSGMMMNSSGNHDIQSASKPYLRSSCKKQAKPAARCAMSPSANGDHEQQTLTRSKPSDHDEVEKENAPKPTTGRVLFETPTKKVTAAAGVEPASTEARRSARIRSIGKSQAAAAAAAGKCV